MPTDVVMPQMGESITEGTIVKWLKQPGEQVERDEPIFEITTDKVDAEIPSPAAGILSSILVPAGKTVGINTIVAIIGGELNAAAPAAEEKPSAAKEEDAFAEAYSGASAASTASSASVLSSPLVRRIAQENNIDLARVKGTGAGGRITKDDVMKHIGGYGAEKQTAAHPPAAAPGELVPMTKMRAIIAQRMLDSKNTNAHVHTIFKVDMTRVVRQREKDRAAFEKRYGVKLTYMPFITAAAVSALRAHPIINASLEGDSIHYHANINIGIAVALEWGLIVPVIKQAESLEFSAIARNIADLAERARSKKLQPEEVAGGTFTLTNSGVFGDLVGLPIINQPQSAILAIGMLAKEPVVVTDADGTDSIAIRSMQYFSLGFDHRIIDGADASKFMADFKRALEGWSAPAV